MMRGFYDNAIPSLWLIWLLCWGAAAFSAKRTWRRESAASRVSHMAPLVLGVALLVGGHMPLAWLNARFLPRSTDWFWVGFCLVALGLAFAVAARVQLGGNWSGVVAVKQGHELIRGGPYRWVRHPIYAGLLLAILGSVTAAGEWRGLLALTLIAAAILRRISVEEIFLTQHFGAAYTRYRAHVPALVPLPRRHAR